MRCHPRRTVSIGNKTRSENEVLVCDRIKGSIGCRLCPVKGSLPVNTARPKAADTPHKNAADAINKYPRSGCEDLELELTEFRLGSPNPMMGPEQTEGQAISAEFRV